MLSIVFRREQPTDAIETIFFLWPNGFSDCYFYVMKEPSEVYNNHSHLNGT